MFPVIAQCLHFVMDEGTCSRQCGSQQMKRLHTVFIVTLKEVLNFVGDYIKDYSSSQNTNNKL